MFTSSSWGACDSREGVGNTRGVKDIPMRVVARTGGTTFSFGFCCCCASFGAVATTALLGASAKIAFSSRAAPAAGGVGTASAALREAAPVFSGVVAVPLVFSGAVAVPLHAVAEADWERSGPSIRSMPTTRERAGALVGNEGCFGCELFQDSSSSIALRRSSVFASSMRFRSDSSNWKHN